jgi:O-succinylbenzoic acid--CoA ligase
VTRHPSLAASARLAAASDPDGLAVLDGTTRWSWRALDDRVDAVAAALDRAGAGPGTRVALLAGPSSNVVAALHAIARVGAVGVPLPAGLTDRELSVALEITAPAVVLRDADLADAIAAPSRAGRDDHDPDPDAPAAIVLTSGTTGRPKAAVLSGRALAASAEGWLAMLPPATGWLLAVGLAHVAGLGVIWRAALTGVPLVIAWPDPESIVGALAADPRPSHVSLVATTLVRILDTTDDASPPDTVRAVPLGGGAIGPALVRRALAAGWPVVPTYGLTEAGSGVTALPSSQAAEHAGTAGSPLPGVSIRIADPDADGIGEVVVDGPGRFSGYLDDPIATAAATSDDGWLRTGDLGRLDTDGRLIVVDRRTDRIVRGGENVSPAEVEAVLLAHPAIADAAVVGRPDPTWGHVPVAAIVVREGTVAPTDDDLAAFCRDRLARFKVPVAFERRIELPHTPSGKLRRAELRATPDTAMSEDLPA